MARLARLVAKKYIPHLALTIPLPITKAFYHLSQYLRWGYSSISDGGIGAFSNNHSSL